MVCLVIPPVWCTNSSTPNGCNFHDSSRRCHTSSSLYSGINNKAQITFGAIFGGSVATGKWGHPVDCQPIAQKRELSNCIVISHPAALMVQGTVAQIGTPGDLIICGIRIYAFVGMRRQASDPVDRRAMVQRVNCQIALWHQLLNWWFKEWSTNHNNKRSNHWCHWHHKVVIGSATTQQRPSRKNRMSKKRLKSPSDHSKTVHRMFPFSCSNTAYGGGHSSYSHVLKANVPKYWLYQQQNHCWLWCVGCMAPWFSFQSFSTYHTPPNHQWCRRWETTFDWCLRYRSWWMFGLTNTDRLCWNEDAPWLKKYTK